MYCVRRGGEEERSREGKDEAEKRKKASPIKGIRATRINYALAASSKPYI